MQEEATTHKRFIYAAVLSVFILRVGFSLGARPKQPSVPARGQGILDVEVVNEVGKPLPGALVSLPGYRSVTGLAGTCRFGLPPGRYAILISKEGYRGRRVNVGVRPAQTTRVRVKLQKLPPGLPKRK